jgi:hypothetical protein
MIQYAARAARANLQNIRRALARPEFRPPS